MYGNELSGNCVALSHCWSENSIITTTRGTLRTHMERVSWTRLSKTFQDAILVTRELGVNFLWIDSPCIGQDNSEEWGKRVGDEVTGVHKFLRAPQCMVCQEWRRLGFGSSSLSIWKAQVPRSNDFSKKVIDQTPLKRRASTNPPTSYSPFCEGPD